ncbi:50S ribosomal protein L22 [bacterium]|jgi:large subunit ribosomal protein L22|nr:50S ribosomal protein L22 [bacterium]
MNAKVNFVRITPRKMGLIVDEVRGKNINDALTYLKFSPRKRTATVIATLLKSAVANADRKGTVDVDKLFVKTILVGGGTILKRFRPRAKGSAFRINKRTSNVSVTLAERT